MEDEGAAITVTAVVADTGKITGSVAPNTGQKVYVDYSFSPLEEEYVAGKQDEADSWIDTKLKGVAVTPVNPVPGLISTIAELYAAGLILIRDWGSKSDTELTSKDGYSKIKTARSLIEDYIAGIKADKASIVK